MWRSISSATTTRARDGSGDIGLLYPWYLLHACQVLDQFDRTLVQIDSV